MMTHTEGAVFVECWDDDMILGDGGHHPFG